MSDELERIAKLEAKKELEDIKVQIGILTTKIEVGEKLTLDYRTQLCDKIEDVKGSIRDIMFAISKLPCDKRDSRYGSLTTQVRVMWAFLTAMVMVVVSEYIGIKKK